MMRRLFVAVAVLLLSGLLPLAAAAGVCAVKPCCRAHAHRSAASLANPTCCGETTCDTSANSDEATNAKSITVLPQLFAIPVAARTAVVGVESSESPRRIDTGPPTRQRLATLSILLI